MGNIDSVFVDGNEGLLPNTVNWSAGFAVGEALSAQLVDGMLVVSFVASTTAEVMVAIPSGESSVSETAAVNPQVDPDETAVRFENRAVLENTLIETDLKVVVVLRDSTAALWTWTQSPSSDSPMA